ncbi:hypothetical protein SAMN05444360_11355 [Chryseobacterium carnipullorum]|uniref:hypothetical protein n=1 Tax=Chryseobacterium carnipullorum TaxID=1124835 RepID=UPI00091F0F8D|nr:hypothetical protein [Chryseobacterium carnipullorum]SHM52502.1 hypothetical protein SAMN05444360_11355 [Chryseobacterium carnipullorum]
MKKYLLGILFLSVLSCGSSDDSENLITNDPALLKIKTLTLKDEDVVNGVTFLYEKLDFKFEYNNDQLVKVWDINGNYTESLTYVNGLLSGISITGYMYPQLHLHNPLDIRRKLTYTNQKLSKSEVLEQPLDGKVYTTFEYPSNDIIIARDYTKYYLGQINNTMMFKIYITNQNVTKVETYQGENAAALTHTTIYEYDQNINPNFLIDKNRILGLPSYGYNIFSLRDYSQISKNNVVKKKTYFSTVQDENLMGEFNTFYQYQSNGLPSTIYYKENDPNNYLKVSAIYGY